MFIDRLPGAPDNLSPTEDGGFIINLIQPRSAALDTLAAWKSVRRFIAAVLCLADLMFQKIDERYPNDFNKNMMASVSFSFLNVYVEDYKRSASSTMLEIIFGEFKIRAVIQANSWSSSIYHVSFVVQDATFSMSFLPTKSRK